MITLTASGGSWYHYTWTDPNFPGHTQTFVSDTDLHSVGNLTLRATYEDHFTRLAEKTRNRAVAETKAEALITEILGPDLAAHRLRYGWYEIKGSCGTVYQIHRGQFSGNVMTMRNGAPYRSYCAHFRNASRYPSADVELGQILMLLADESTFRAIAYG